MDLTELKTYVSSHAQVSGAFYALADRVYASPQKTLNSPEDLAISASSAVANSSKPTSLDATEMRSSS